MLKVGLTGGIASGKSSVGEMFVALGANLIQADGIAHQLMAPGEEVYEEIVRQFGREILNADATINRAKLAEEAFGSSSDSQNKNASRIQELNRIVHPAVIRRQDEWIAQMMKTAPDGVAMVEAALILEAGTANHFDRLIVVTCTEDQRVFRFAARQKISLEEARKDVARRMAAQMPDEEKIRAAHFVIDNSGPLEVTAKHVSRIWSQLSSEAAESAAQLSRSERR